MIEQKNLKNGELIQEIKYGTTYHFIVKNGKKIKHRDNGPAIDGEREKEWWVYGKRHNEHGPARIFWAWTNDRVAKPIFDSNGERVWNEQWFVNDKMHRMNAPANIIRNGNGYEEWYENGVLHRTNGPAQTICGKSHYWINGYKFNYNDYLKVKVITKIQKAFEKFIQQSCIGRHISEDGSSINKQFKRGSYKVR